MTHITITKTFGTVENLIKELNDLPVYNRKSALEVKTYDGWKPKTFNFIGGSFQELTNEPNATKDDLAIGCLHSVGGYWVSNEGSKKAPNYHVWVPGITHSTCDSAYNDLSLAVCRCNYLAKNSIKL